MSRLRETLSSNSFIRSLYYHYRAIKERYSYCSSKSSVSVEGIRINTLIQVSGGGNFIQVMPQALLKKAKIFVHGNNNKIIIRQNAYLEGSVLHIEDNDCLIEIGEHTFIGPSHMACTEDGNSIKIGKDCMLSSNINIRTGDSHSILDAEGKRINRGQSVAIGDHVWIGEGAKIMKGVHLQKDTIVASGAIVTHSFPSNVILGGNPAKCIKDGVTWDEKRI